MNRPVAIAAAAAILSSSALCGGPTRLRFARVAASGRRSSLRLAGYSKESSTTLNIGIVKEKWANAEGRVDVTGDAGRLRLRLARTARPLP